MAHFSHHLLTALPVPLMPLIREEFALDYGRSGVALSVFNLAYGISQLPAGWLAGRIGPRILITIGICGVALAGLLIGFSQTFVMMIVFMILMGVLGGGYHPSAPPLISASVEPKRQGRALGFHLVGGSASFFLSPLIAVAISSAWGWRAPFVVMAVPTIIYGIIFYLVLRRLANPANFKQENVPESRETTTSKSPLRRLVPVIALVSLTQSAIIATAAFIPLYLVDQFGVAKETAGAFISIFYSAGIWAAPLGGYLSDRLGRIPVLITVCFLAGPIVCALNFATYGIGIGITLVIMGMLMYFLSPTTEAYIVNNTSERHRSTVLGIMYFCVIETGGLITLPLGYMIEEFGFYNSFNIIGAALLAIALIGSIFIWSSRKNP